MANPASNQLSPSGYNPYGQSQALDELKQLNPDAYQQYLNTPRELNFDYRDSHFFKKRPTLSGVPGRSW